MNENRGLPLIAPKITPVLDPNFRRAVLANAAFRRLVSESGKGLALRLAIEQADGNISISGRKSFSRPQPQSRISFMSSGCAAFCFGRGAAAGFMSTARKR